MEQIAAQPNAATQYPGQLPEQALVPSGVATVNSQQALQTAQQLAHREYRDPEAYFPGQHMKRGVTAFIFGAPGTWKTTFAGQFPKPIFLSVGVEGGDDALAMLPSLFGIQVPPVYNITSTEMMKKKVDFLAQNYKALDINTVVVDSITYYVDLWIAQLMALRYDDPKIRKKIQDAGGEATNMTMRDWGLLAMHIRDLAVTLHNTDMNVLWLALEKEIKETGNQDGSSRIVGVEPYIRGESQVKLPGMCKMIIHAERNLKPDPNAMGRMMSIPTYYVSPNYKTKLLRHKYGNAFPEGKLIDPNYAAAGYQDMPTFNSIYSRIGNFIYAT